MNKIRSFFLYLSVTDKQLIKKCPERELLIQEIIGISVLITAVFASFSGAYAIYKVFDHGVLSITIGILWGYTIMNIDRQLVSSFRTSGTASMESQIFSRYLGPLFLRMPLAILLGVIISIPLELRIFEAEIDEYLRKAERTKLTELRDNLHVAHLERKNDHAYEVQRFEFRIDSLEQMRTSVQENIGEEERKPVTKYVTRRDSSGELYQVRLIRESARLALLKQQFDDYTQQIGELKREFDSKKMAFLAVTDKHESEVDSMVIAEAGYGRVYDSFVTRYGALKDITEDPSNAEIGFGIRLTIILIEIMPVLLKVLSENKQYGRFMESGDRRQAEKMEIGNIR